MLWKSKGLKKWTGPFKITRTDSEFWMGPNPMIWAAELYQYKGKYYYFATFTNRGVKIDTVGENIIECRASHVLVSDQPEGPYVPMKDPTYLPADKPTLEGPWLHSHKSTNGRTHRVPHLFEVDFSGDRLVVGKPYLP